jgi:hypothetical protein
MLSGWRWETPTASPMADKTVQRSALPMERYSELPKVRYSELVSTAEAAKAVVVRVVVDMAGAQAVVDSEEGWQRCTCRRPVWPPVGNWLLVHSCTPGLGTYTFPPASAARDQLLPLPYLLPPIHTAEPRNQYHYSYSPR